MPEPERDLRLLIVDDEVEFLHAMERGLSRRGFDVALAETGIEALEQLISHSFDAVVLDVKMPGIDGVTVFREIKGDYPDLPVVLLTGHANIEQAFETSREGVHDYLAKPCDVDTLAHILRKVVARRAGRLDVGRKDGETISILLVDDDSDFLRSIAPALNRRSVAVSTAGNASEALQILRDASVEVAVVDLVMPGVDGMALLQRLREEDPLLEVIILTGKPRIRDARRSLKEGAFDYLTKPCNIEELVDAIRAAHERRRKREEEAREASVERILQDQPDY